MRRLTTVLVSVLLGLLAACQPAPDLGLTLPTPITDGESLTAVPAMATPASASPTAPVAGTAPPVFATVPPPPTLVATQPPTPSPQSPENTTGYSVAYVELGDTLNVRSGPGANYPIVAELPRDATGLTVDDSGQSLVAGSTWVWIERADVAGYVNSRYLTQSVSAAEFCQDPAVDAILDDLRMAITNRDGELLASLVHPERGLRLRHSWWNDEILLRGNEVTSLFADDTVYEWGTADGSGLPITGTFSTTLLPLLNRDLLPAGETACNEVRHGPTAGMTIVPQGHEAVPFVSLYRAAGPGESEFDWGAWVVGIEQWDGRLYLSTLVHYAYEI